MLFTVSCVAMVLKNSFPTGVFLRPDMIMNFSCNTTYCMILDKKKSYEYLSKFWNALIKGLPINGCFLI